MLLGRWGICTLGLGLAFGAGLGVTSGCGGDPGCEETRSCAAAVEDAGTDAPIDSSSKCLTDSDCDDGLPCNGTERCADGACTTGTPVVCSTAQPAHCGTTCVDGPGGHDCVIYPLDLDLDKHGDALCTESLTIGDDCDDSTDAVFPGAPELCDGIDNDCNGKRDLDDGLPLGGVLDVLVTSPGEIFEPQIAWSDAAQLYGVVWMDARDGESDIYFTRMDAAGNKVGIDLEVGGSPGIDEHPRIAASGDEFLIASTLWANETLTVRRVSASSGFILGASTTLLAGINHASAVIADGSSGWIVGRGLDTTAVLQRLGADAKLTGPETTIGSITEDPLNVALAQVGGVTLFGWSDTTGAFGTAYVGSNLQVLAPGPTAPASTLGSAMVRATTQGASFVLGWTLSDFAAGTGRLSLQRSLGDASVVCETPDLVSVVGGSPVLAGIASNGSGSAVAYTVISSAGQVTTLYVAFVDSECKLVFQPVSLGDGNIFNLGIASDGASGTAIVTVGPTGKELVRRIVPKTYCD